MLAILFLVIFTFEWLFSKRQERSVDVNVKTGEDETIAELMQEIQKEFHKTWEITYKEYQIRIVNEYNGEKLYINDQLVAEKKRTTWYSWLKMSQILRATLGNGSKLVVKLSGFLSLKCAVYVDKKLIFQEKVEYNVLTGEMKDKDKK